MAMLELTSDVSTVSLTMRGAVDRKGVEELRAALAETEAKANPDDGHRGQWVAIDLREVTDFSRLGIAVLVAAHRFFGDRLRIRLNEAVLALLDEAGLTRVLHPGF
ncbi:MAG TPA: hypothetical protein VLR26_15350 [Frankiaceae bacterium]|nr:hypothetical protein [Frankiaceae bacterium]